MRVVALVFKFLLELSALAAVAYWGSRTGPVVVNVLLALAAPLLVAVAWGRFAAPKSQRRLPRGPRLAFELGVFGVAALALVAADAPGLGAALFAAAVAVEVAVEV